jgi:hypothetical protein
MSVVMMKKTEREKSHTSESASVLRKLDEHLDGENVKSVIAASLDIRKREALKPLHLDRYE